MNLSKLIVLRSNIFSRYIYLMTVGGLIVNLQVFDAKKAVAQVHFDELEATKVLVWFYGSEAIDSKIRDAGGMTPIAIQYTEEMLNSTLQCSMAMGYVQAVYESTAFPSFDLTKTARKLSTNISKQWLRSKMGRSGKVYQTCKDRVAQQYKGAVLAALEIN